MTIVLESSNMLIMSDNTTNAWIRIGDTTTQLRGIRHIPPRPAVPQFKLGNLIDRGFLQLMAGEAGLHPYPRTCPHHHVRIVLCSILIISNVCSARKRQPLPPQEAEFRGIAKSKSAVYSDSVVQRPRDASRSPAITFHSREKPEKDVATPAPRSYPRRDDTRDPGYSQPPPREPVPVDYERDYHNPERARPRQHHSDQNDADRGYDTPAGPPSIDARGGYQERERDPPSKPRAMQGPAITSTNAYTVAGPSSIPSNLTNRYRDRPSPPHLSTSDSRRDVDARTNPPPGAWLEREEERIYTPLEHPVSRGLFITH